METPQAFYHQFVNMIYSILTAINRHNVWLNASGAEAAITEQGGRRTIIINDF